MRGEVHELVYGYPDKTNPKRLYRENKITLNELCALYRGRISTATLHKLQTLRRGKSVRPDYTRPA